MIHQVSHKENCSLASAFEYQLINKNVRNNKHKKSIIGLSQSEKFHIYQRAPKGWKQFLCHWTHCVESGG